jgi:hypothetical protein
MDNFKFELKANVVEELEVLSQILNKSSNDILNEALENYFSKQRSILIKKNQDDENLLTNLDFNEFWDGLDIE